MSAAKVALFGPSGSGTTLTAIMLAIGISKEWAAGRSIVLVDTDGIAGFVRPVCVAESIRLDVIDAAAFVAMREGLARAEDSGAAALLVDGVDTIHRELTTAQRVAYGLTGERTPRACHDDLAAIWDAWIWAWRASPIDCLATARRGAPHEDVDAAPETDGPITSLEMGADVEIELRATLNRRAAARPTKSRRGAIVHHAYVVKDRTRTLNGRHFAFKDLNDYKAGDYRAVWKAIGPALAATGRSGVLRGESLARTSRDLFPAPGEGGFADATHRRAVAIEEIQASLRALWPGETADEKRLRMLVTYTLFQARSWTAIGALPVETLETAWNTLEEYEVSADGVKVTDDADVVEALAAAATRASSMRSEAVPV